MFLFLISVIRFLFLSKLQDISRLTVKFTADGFKGTKTFAFALHVFITKRLGKSILATIPVYTTTI